MDLKSRLQRMLQIVEGAECNGALADIERDILLNELRQAYTELKFGETEVAHVEPKVEVAAEPVAPVLPVEEDEESEENEVEVELIFDESAEESEEEVVYEAPLDEEPSDEEPIVEEVAEVEEKVEEPTAEPQVEESAQEPAAEEPVAEEPVAEEPIVEEEPAEEETPAIHTPSATSKQSAILSLYEDAPAQIIGEQFQERTSVADTISCPKGVAESAPIKSLHDAIGLADKFLLIHELFGGDSDAYETTINALEEQPSFDDCVIYISENFAWSPHSEGTKMIMELLQRKYNA